MTSTSQICDKYKDFRDRLIKFRESKDFKTKTEFANWLGVPRNSYSMIETGYRPPNQKFFDQLLLKTGKPEEFWVYGVEDDNQYAKAREDFKMLKKAIDDVVDLGLLDLDGNYTSAQNETIAKKLINTALNADIYHILLKKRQGN